MLELPHFAQIRSEPGKRAAWVMAVAVHVLLAIFLIYGIRWQTAAPETVSVDLVRSLTPLSAKKPAMPRLETAPPKPAPALPRREEAPTPPKAEILRKAPDPPRPPLKEQAAQNHDPVSKMLQRETDRMMQNRIADAAAREEAQLKASQATSARNMGLMDYLAKVRGKIRGNIVLPPAINGNPESVFLVTQLPGGEVLSVKLKASSGNRPLDAAIERAILKSSPLPKPDDPSLFERELTIKYRPLDD